MKYWSAWRDCNWTKRHNLRWIPTPFFRPFNSSHVIWYYPTKLDSSRIAWLLPWLVCWSNDKSVWLRKQEQSNKGPSVLRLRNYKGKKKTNHFKGSWKRSKFLNCPAHFSWSFNIWACYFTIRNSDCSFY